jgi:sugar phosphate isomerase/epimerase
VQAQFGAMTRVFSMCSLEEALERIARVGYKYVGLLGQHQRKRPLNENMTAADVLHIRNLLEQHDLRALLAWGGAIDVNNLEPTKVKITRCADLDIETLLLLGPRANLNRTDADASIFLPGEREQFAAALGELVDYASQVNVKLAIKPHGGPTGNAAGLLQLVSTAGAENVGVFYDPGNILFYLGVKPELDLPQVAHKVVGLCVKDHSGPIGDATFPVPGQGDVDWASIFGSLKKHQFAGPAFIEVLTGADADQVETELAQARDFLEHVMDTV